MIHRFKKITDGLYRGSAPNIADVKQLHDKFGIKKIISLDADAGAAIKHACQKLGIEQYIIPLTEKKSSLIPLLKQNLKKLLIDDGPTFIHCKHGIDRTGFLSALFKCKYMGTEPKDAIYEAKSLGFGKMVGTEFSHMIRLYEKLIRKCKKDSNSADIVSNTREYISDNRDSPLQEATQMSFAPYLSTTRQFPYDNVYPGIIEQSPTRENYKLKQPLLHDDDQPDIPDVGYYNNDAGVMGTGFTFPTGGAISE